MPILASRNAKKNIEYRENSFSTKAYIFKNWGVKNVKLYALSIQETGFYFFFLLWKWPNLTEAKQSDIIAYYELTGHTSEHEELRTQVFEGVSQKLMRSLALQQPNR